MASIPAQAEKVKSSDSAKNDGARFIHLLNESWVTAIVVYKTLTDFIYGLNYFLFVDFLKFVTAIKDKAVVFALNPRNLKLAKDSG